MASRIGHRTKLVVLLAVGVVQPVLRADGPATVEVMASTVLGDRVDSGSFELVDRGTGLSLQPHPDRFRAIGVPYGEYTLRLRVPGFKQDERRIRVFQPHVYVRIEVRLAQIVDEEPLRMTGRLTPLPRKDRELWVRIFPMLMGGPTFDSPVAADGRFEFVGIDHGRYIIAVFRGNECIITKPIETFWTTVELSIPVR